MTNALADITEYLNSHDWKFTQDNERPLLYTGFSGDNGQWRCIFALEREETQLSFYSFLPCKAPAKLRRTCSELLARINYRLCTGGFTLDWNDGEIAMKTTAFITGDKVTEEIIDPIMGLNLTTMDQFFHTFMKVLYTGISPKDALDQLDGKGEVRPRFELN